MPETLAARHGWTPASQQSACRENPVKFDVGFARAPGPIRVGSREGIRWSRVGALLGCRWVLVGRIDRTVMVTESVEVATFSNSESATTLTKSRTSRCPI